MAQVVEAEAKVPIWLGRAGGGADCCRQADSLAPSSEPEGRKPGLPLQAGTVGPRPRFAPSSGAGRAADRHRLHLPLGLPGPDVRARLVDDLGQGLDQRRLPAKGFLSHVSVGPLASTFNDIAGATWADWLLKDRAGRHRHRFGRRRRRAVCGLSAVHRNAPRGCWCDNNDRSTASAAHTPRRSPYRTTRARCFSRSGGLACGSAASLRPESTSIEPQDTGALLPTEEATPVVGCHGCQVVCRHSWSSK